MIDCRSETAAAAAEQAALRRPSPDPGQADPGGHEQLLSRRPQCRSDRSPAYSSHIALGPEPRGRARAARRETFTRSGRVVSCPLGLVVTIFMNPVQLQGV